MPREADPGLLPLDLRVHVGLTPARTLRAKASYDRSTISIELIHVGHAPMQYAMHESDAADGRLFECAEFTQRVHSSPVSAGTSVRRGAYVVSGSGTATIEGRQLPPRPGTALFVARGTPWSAEGDARAVSVLVDDPTPAAATHAVVDLHAVERGEATAGRAFRLAATPRSAASR